MNKNENFAKKVLEKYGDIYDVSNVNYIDAKSTIYPYCKKHKKVFKTTRDHFLNSNQICDECKKEKQKVELKKSFVERSRKIHGDEYTYENVKYENEKKEVLVTCKKHGDFLVKPCIHTHPSKNRGKCPKCESEKKHKEYVEYCVNNHKIKYDYSKLDLDNPREDGKVCIICPIHGEFWQKPSSHKRGNECPKCDDESKKSNTKEFIEKSRKIHGDKYDYSKVEYIKSHIKVIIICPNHGEFLVAPNNHLRGKGCPKCIGRYKTTNDIIKEFTKIHGKEYDYSEIEYRGATNKVKIKCNKCGEYFYQTPNKHLSGEGCPSCKSSMLEKETKAFLEMHNIKFEREHREQWLGYQRLDFYLPEYNVAIECQGSQHFAMFYNTEEMFEKIKSNDLKKYNLCKEHGIRVFYYAKNNKRYICETYIDKIYFNLNEILKEITNKNFQVEEGTS